MSELTKQLRIKAGMINLGERIEWGSETALMETAANRIDHLEAELAKLKGEYEWVASINTALDESNQSAWDELARLRAGQEPVGWLVSLELPEVQCNCAWNPDSHDKTCPVYLRDRMADAQRAIAELLEALENTATWIEQLPVPTVGAAGQLVKIDKAIAAAR